MLKQQLWKATVCVINRLLFSQLNFNQGVECRLFHTWLLAGETTDMELFIVVLSYLMHHFLVSYFLCATRSPVAGLHLLHLWHLSHHCHLPPQACSRNPLLSFVMPPPHKLSQIGTLFISCSRPNLYFNHLTLSMPVSWPLAPALSNPHSKKSFSHWCFLSLAFWAKPLPW